MNFVKSVDFIVEKEKLDNFAELIIEIKLKFNEKIGFDLNYLSDIEEWHKKQSKKFSEVLTRFEKEEIVAMAINIEWVVFISNFFWNKSKDEQICIILHELGHIKYPISKVCSFLTNHSGDNMVKEYLADSYIKEVSKEFAQKRFTFWFQSFNEKFDISAFKKEFDFDEFSNLIFHYFNLYYFKKITNLDLIENSLILIKRKFLSNLNEFYIQEITQLILEYLDYPYNWEKGKALDELLDKAENNILPLSISR